MGLSFENILIFVIENVHFYLDIYTQKCLDEKNGLFHQVTKPKGAYHMKKSFLVLSWQTVCSQHLENYTSTICRECNRCCFTVDLFMAVSV